jgi:hypothetical protein
MKYVYLIQSLTVPSQRYLARIIHEASAASTDTRLRRAVSPFTPSTYCMSMPQGFTAPCARLASRLRAFPTNLYEYCGLWHHRQP